MMILTHDAKKKVHGVTSDFPFPLFFMLAGVGLPEKPGGGPWKPGAGPTSLLPEEDTSS